MIVPIFTTDICRSIGLVYEEEQSHLGITGYKYAFPDSFYQHPKDNNDNYCFCPSPVHPGLKNDCAEGLIRLFTCQGKFLTAKFYFQANFLYWNGMSRFILGGPFVTSSPHFYKGDKLFSDKLIGMAPDKDKHETFLLLQPVRISLSPRSSSSCCK